MLFGTALSEIIRQIQKNASLFSAFGAFFHDIGDFRHSEEAYISYVRVIESNFGSAALETSNCYFLLGAFYTEHVTLKVSSINMRIEILYKGNGLSKDSFKDSSAKVPNRSS